MKRLALIALAVLSLVGGTADAANLPLVNPLTEQRYRAFWERADSFFGADGKPAPRFTAAPREHSEGGMAVFWERGRPSVYLDPRSARLLGSVGKRSRLLRNETRTRLLHEWAHVYQPSDFGPSYDREGGANLFQMNIARKMRRQGLIGKFPAFTATPQTQAFQQKYGPRFWRRAQFGENYGADPLSIGPTTTYPY